jgi:hypothetical protein
MKCQAFQDLYPDWPNLNPTFILILDHLVHSGSTKDIIAVAQKTVGV